MGIDDNFNTGVGSWEGSDRDIIPDELQDELTMLRGKILWVSFRIGDIANLLATQSAKVGLPITDKRIFEAVGRFCGKSGRTVRYYAETAAFFGDDVREEFHMLPFAFFVFARTMNEDWENVLGYAAENPHITLDALRAQFLHKDQESSHASVGLWVDDLGASDGSWAEDHHNKTNDDEKKDQPEKTREHSHDFYKQRIVSLVGETGNKLSEIYSVILELEIDSDDSTVKYDIEDAINALTRIAKWAGNY